MEQKLLDKSLTKKKMIEDVFFINNRELFSLTSFLCCIAVFYLYAHCILKHLVTPTLKTFLNMFNTYMMKIICLKTDDKVNYVS